MSNINIKIIKSPFFFRVLIITEMKKIANSIKISQFLPLPYSLYNPKQIIHNTNG